MTLNALFAQYLGAPPVADCFGAEAFTAHMLAFEVALAEAEAELEIIPHAAARAIIAAAEVGRFDLVALARDTVGASNPAIPLVEALTALVAAEDRAAARYVHWGATSQDVVDSAMMLAARAACEIIDGALARLSAALLGLIAAHRDTTMVARTLSQQAGPTTFALKCAGWLNGMSAARGELARARLALPLQFGGATGTLAALGVRGLEVGALLAERLALRAAPPWHTERSTVRTLAAALAGIAAAGGKLAHDLVAMAQSEVGEIAEQAAAGRGGSSALPHKRNPVAAIAALAAARRAPALLATVFGAFDQAHERAAGPWHTELLAMAELCETAGAVVSALGRALDGIEIDTAAMRHNLDTLHGLGMSEAVAMALAPAIGRGPAQAVVKQACATAVAERRDLVEVLAADEQVIGVLGDAGLARAFAPEHFLGVADALVDAAVVRATRSHEPEEQE